MIGKRFKNKVSTEISELLEFYRTDILKNGLGIEDFNSPVSTELETVLEEVDFAFGVYARQYLTDAMGVSTWHKAIITSEFPEFDYNGDSPSKEEDSDNSEE